MIKNLYKITYEDKEIEYWIDTEVGLKEETKRLKNLDVKFTVSSETAEKFEQAFKFKGKES
jgi:hypothetical protein